MELDDAASRRCRLGGLPVLVSQILETTENIGHILWTANLLSSNIMNPTGEIIIYMNKIHTFVRL